MINTETPSLPLFRAQYGQANIVQQKSQLVAFYLKNYIITRTLDFLKTERAQGKDISEMTTDIHNWFQDLEGLKQSLGSQLQDMDTCRQQFFDFTYYHFSRCDAQYKNNVRSQQMADELASVLLLTEAYSIFNIPDQQVDHMRNFAKNAHADVLKSLQNATQKFQPTYSTYSQPPNQGIVYHGHELETPNPDMMGPGASMHQGFPQGQSIANQNQHHSIKTPGSTTGPVSALSGFQMVESSFVSKDALAQKRSQAVPHPGANQIFQSQQHNIQSQSFPLSQQQAAAQDKELIHLDDLLSSMQPGNNQASQQHQSQHHGQAGRGPSAYQVGQSIRPADNNQGGGAFSGFNMAESNYVPQQSIGQNQNAGFQGVQSIKPIPDAGANNQGGAFSGFNMASSNYVPQHSIGQNQAGPGFQGVQSIKPTPGANNQGDNAFSGFNMASSNYVPQQSIGQNQHNQAGPGGFQGAQSIKPIPVAGANNQGGAFSGFNMASSNYVPQHSIGQNQQGFPQQNIQGYNQSQQGHSNRMEVEAPNVPFGQTGVLTSQYYNPNAGNAGNAGNFNNNAENYASQPFNFKQSAHPNQPGPGHASNLPGPGQQQNFYGQNAQNTGMQEESKRDISRALPSKQGGGPNAGGPPLNVPNDKYHTLKELCRMTISELDYKNVKEAKENIRKALSIIREHNPGM